MPRSRLLFSRGCKERWTESLTHADTNWPAYFRRKLRDESLVFSDHIDNVPEEYRHVGTSILMENDRGQTRSFLVTHLDDEMLTVDGNNPLCGREVVFALEILTVRDATDDERRAGGAIPKGADVDPSLLRSV